MGRLLLAKEESVMANQKKPGDRAPQDIQFKIEYEGKPDAGLDVSAYLFDTQGNLIASAPVAKGAVKLRVERMPRRPRLMIGPTLASEAAPSVAMLERLNAYAPPWRFEPGRAAYELPPIPDFLWPHWPRCRCRVRGRVVKRTVSPGGVIVEAPVCNARVHICEVDPLWWIIGRLPDDIIRRIRDDLFVAIRKPFPWPPEPDPPFDRLHERIDISPETSRMRNKASAAQLFGGSRADAVALNPQPLPPLETFALTHRAGGDAEPLLLAAETKVALASRSTQIVRQALLDNLALLRPWICGWDWLYPWFYRCEELRVLTTGDDGRFDTFIWYPCLGDQPDLYFWVEYSIGGVWTTVYHPPIPCNVWWNYACGTDVTIRVTDPRVSGCGSNPDVPGKVVIVKTIGNEVSMGEIGRDAAPDDPAKAGTVRPGWLHSTRESPFGGVLEPRVDFGDGLVPAGITHYRWSQRPLGSVNDADWQVIDPEVRRHYREKINAPGDPVIYKSVVVGPDPAVAGQYFLIEPVLPANGDDWESLEDHYDQASAYWNTNGVSPAKYELKLELFKKVAGVMTRVNLTAAGVTLHQVVTPAPLTGGTYVTAPATPDRQLLDAGSLVGFRLVLHVDNRVCSGTIEPATVAPGANDTKCGFQEYTPASLATVSFRAAHPANFAYFDFDLVRVATALPSASASGLVDDAMVNGFSRGGDLFAKAIPVTTMFNEGLPPGEEPCIRAAFGEALRVYALATDGYDRLSGYDAPRAALGEIALRAFALTPA
jgi:hypothetical protein